MHYKSDLLNNYDLFPKVVVCGKKTTINIRPLGGRMKYEPGREYTLVISAVDGGFPPDFPAAGDFRKYRIQCDENGGFSFEYTFESEQEYIIRFCKDDDVSCETEEFSVYCVEEDLNGRYPFMGDLHMHSNLSDGCQNPEVVAANYRRYGYDFTVISDHCRYYPSLRAIESYKNVKTEFNIVPGEEVHLPPVYGKTNDVHIVNFGGEYSINALTEGAQISEVGTDRKYRSLYGECPDVLSYEEFQAKIQALADKADVPENVDAVPWAMSCWICDEIRKAKGLSIFAHPNWRYLSSYHVPETFTDFMMEKQPFDAFEVLGGELYYEQNGFQTARYYDERAKGHRFPIVGSTDSHSSYESNKAAFICETIVFSPENERKALISSIKDFYSVAVDTISKEPRLVGETRFIRYGWFLLKHFFPLHDELCYEEGRLMKQYVTGTDEEKTEAARTLQCIYGRMKKQREKYFDFS